MISRRSSGSKRVDSAVEPDEIAEQHGELTPFDAGVGRVTGERLRRSDLCRVLGWLSSCGFRAAPGQKLAPAESACPQALQTGGAAAPHPTQNLAASGRMAPQPRHCIRYWQTVPGGRKTWRVMAFACETPFTV